RRLEGATAGSRSSRPEAPQALFRLQRRPAGKKELTADGDGDMIELDQVSKTYGVKPAVIDLTLRIERGELFAFIGPNGAGKTTTIKMLCGLLFPTSGTIRVAGRDLRTHGQAARRVTSYVPDQPFLYEKLTGREVLQFIADMYGLSADHAQRRIDAMID